MEKELSQVTICKAAEWVLTESVDPNHSILSLSAGVIDGHNALEYVLRKAAGECSYVVRNFVLGYLQLLRAGSQLHVSGVAIQLYKKEDQTYVLNMTQTPQSIVPGSFVQTRDASPSSPIGDNNIEILFGLHGVNMAMHTDSETYKLSPHISYQDVMDCFIQKSTLVERLKITEIFLLATRQIALASNDA